MGIKEPDLWFDCWMKPRNISIFRGFFKMKNNENKRYVTKAIPLYRAKGDIYYPFITRNSPHLGC